MVKHRTAPQDADLVLKTLPVDWHIDDLRRIWELWKLIPVGQLSDAYGASDAQPDSKRGRPKGSVAYHGDILLMPIIEQRVCNLGEKLGSVCRSLAQNTQGQSVDSTRKRLERKFRAWKSAKQMGQ